MSVDHHIAHFLRELDGTDPGRRAAAAKALGRVGGREHTATLVRAAGDPDPEVRAAPSRPRPWAGSARVRPSAGR